MLKKNGLTSLWLRLLERNKLINKLAICPMGCAQTHSIKEIILYLNMLQESLIFFCEMPLSVLID